MSLIHTSILTYLIAALVIFVSCDELGRKASNGTDHTKDSAKLELADTVALPLPKAVTQKPKEDTVSVEDLENFCTQQEEKIRTNEKFIGIVRMKVKIDDEHTQEVVNKKADDLEHENNRLKNEIYGYKVTSKAKWEVFKRDFTSELNILSASIKALKTSPHE